MSAGHPVPPALLAQLDTVAEDRAFLAALRQERAVRGWNPDPRAEETLRDLDAEERMILRRIAASRLTGPHPVIPGLD